MTWTRLSDNYFDRPESLALSRSARLLDIEGMVWCNRMLTDGAIPAGALPRLSDSPSLAEDVAELLAVDVWAEDGTGGYRVAWDDQESAAAVLARREAAKDRSAAYRRRGEMHRRGDHAECTANCPSRRDERSDEQRDERRTSRPFPSPVPSRPEGTGRGTGKGAPAPPAVPAGRPAPEGEIVYDLDWPMS